ncbi:MAG TPA: NAD(P)-dependent oxidoreductase [Armatimonadota bacterium]|nr:NAD(P)-dependent oxidoreductase [Armatimonadota bacterium]
MERLGFLGLGIMGRGMAVNLAKAGYPLTVWNRTRSKAREFAAVGAKVADTPRQAAEGSDVVIMMLADPAAVEAAAYGPDGVVAGLDEGAVLIDCSTVDPGTSQRLAEAAGKRGARFLDSPVAGSKKAAEDGELILMVGGDEDTLAKVRPVLDRLSKKLIHAGGTGMGTYLKLCFNLVVAHMTTALSETLILGAKAGLDPKLILDTINSGAIGSRFYEWKGSCILNRDFTTNFSLKLMHKDLKLLMSAAYDLGVPLPVTASVKELFGTAKSCCGSEEDFCSVIRALETATHFEVKG